MVPLKSNGWSQLLILAPGSTVVLGHLHLKTKSILSCTLLHGLLLSYLALIIFESEVIRYD